MIVSVFVAAAIGGAVGLWVASRIPVPRRCIGCDKKMWDASMAVVVCRACKQREGYRAFRLAKYRS